VLAVLLVAQLAAAASPSPSSDQDKVTAAEVLAYAEWRNCVLKVTHHVSRRVKDHAAVADAAIEQCAAKETSYRASLTTLAELYQLKDTGGFAGRNVDQARKALHAMAMKELQ
jgi:hypothetical protein